MIISTCTRRLPGFIEGSEEGEFWCEEPREIMPCVVWWPRPTTQHQSLHFITLPSYRRSVAALCLHPHTEIGYLGLVWPSGLGNSMIMMVAYLCCDFTYDKSVAPHQ